MIIMPGQLYQLPQIEVYNALLLTEEEHDAAVEWASHIKDIIFVGDSRVVGMSYIGGFHYEGEVGSNYAWLSNGGMSAVYNDMSAYPDAAVVFCLGINDVYSVSPYISCYEALLEAYPDRTIRLMSVNPIDDAVAHSVGYSISSSDIDAFNNSLREAFPEEYLDMSSEILERGFYSSDGIHYGAELNQWIQEKTLEMLNMQQESSISDGGDAF